MLTIDGSFGEGGGQIIRSALALSMVTGRAFRVENVRAGRKKPGLMRQHLTAVRAAASVCGADVAGDAIGSTALTFEPGPLRPGEYAFGVGTAGSATLVLQTVLPALLIAPGPSAITVEGGTHNPFAPPFDFLAKTFLPLVNRMGPRVAATLARPGFYPAGGGRFDVRVEPAGPLQPIDVLDRGEVRRRRARAVVANLPRGIAERELKVVARKLGWAGDELAVEEVDGSAGPGNVLMLEVESDAVTEVFTGFGELGRAAEAVANHAVAACQKYLASGAPVGEHLADQLLLPMAIAGGGRFRTTPLSRHATTQIDLIGRFLGRAIDVQTQASRGVVVAVRSPEVGGAGVPDAGAGEGTVRPMP